MNAFEEKKPMESRFEPRPNPAKEEVINIGRSVFIKGELTGDEDLTIEGRVEGKIELKDHNLVIGPNGKINAEINAKNVTISNMLVRHYLANGVFWHDTNTSDKKATCQNAVAKNVDVEFNHSYGLFMFGCEGGAFNKSNGWGHGDCAPWQRVAGRHAGVSVNDWVDDGVVDPLIGQSVLNGVPVRLGPATPSTATAGHAASTTA